MADSSMVEDDDEEMLDLHVPTRRKYANPENEKPYSNERMKAMKYFYFYFNIIFVNLNLK